MGSLVTFCLLRQSSRLDQKAKEWRHSVSKWSLASSLSRADDIIFL
jgi:hypothetical protein